MSTELIVQEFTNKQEYIDGLAEAIKKCKEEKEVISKEWDESSDNYRKNIITVSSYLHYLEDCKDKGIPVRFASPEEYKAYKDEIKEKSKTEKEKVNSHKDDGEVIYFK